MVGFGSFDGFRVQYAEVATTAAAMDLLPTFLDAPDVRARLIEEPDHWGPFGAKGVGESPHVGGVPCFSNAIQDAFRPFGNRHTNMPHDHWRIWKTANNLGLHG